MLPARSSDHQSKSPLLLRMVVAAGAAAEVVAVPAALAEVRVTARAARKVTREVKTAEAEATAKAPTENPPNHHLSPHAVIQVQIVKGARENAHVILRV